MCEAHEVDPDPPLDHDKVGIALATLHLRPLNGLRHARGGGTSGWYVWGGEELRSDADFFQPLHRAHLREKCPEVVRFLALPPGWRFLTDGDHDDVWEDPTLLGGS